MKCTYNYIYVPEELPDVPSSTMEVEAENFYMKWTVSKRIPGYYSRRARVDMDAEIILRRGGKKIRRRFRRSAYIENPEHVNNRIEEVLFVFKHKVRSMLK